MERKITVREASQETGYSTEYIRELCREGKVKAEKFGTVLVIDRASLIQYKRSQERKRR